MSGAVARVAALHRYPVKSMTGERLDVLELDARGVAGDRAWSVRTAAGTIGSGKSSRRFAAVRGLLDLRAAVRDGAVVVTFPDGSSCLAADAAERVSRYVGQPVTLQAETDVSHFDDGPVSLLGLPSVDAVAAEQGQDVHPDRFRANLVLAGLGPLAEHAWTGRDVQVGTAVLTVTAALPRCVMVNAATADLAAQPGTLAAVGRVNDAHLGVVATVREPGRVRVGDPVVLLS